MVSSTETNAWGLEVLPEAPHLGGYVKGGDPRSWEPALWERLIEREGVRSMLDVGCGSGETVGWFSALGVDALGVDGVPQDREDVLVHDFTEGALIVEEGYDLVWSCEFVEHVQEAFLPYVVDTFACARLVLLTHALPGQPGHHHVNCRPADYWIGALAAIGYAYDATLTARARQMAQGYYADTGLAFRRRP